MAAGLSSCLTKEKTNMSFDAALEPLYDQEVLSREEQILIMLETILIDNFLARVKTTEETIVDFEVDLKFIADWIEELKNAQNVYYVKCIKDGEQIMLLNTADYT